MQGGWDVDVDSNDEIVCTITNSRNTGSLEVEEPRACLRHRLFNLFINDDQGGAVGDGATDVGDEGTTGPESVVPGTYTVGETAGTGTNLSKYTTSVECLNHAGEGDPTPVTETEVQGGWDVDVDSNDEIVCTIANSRNTGSLEVVKNLEPASDTGLFNLFINDDQGGAVGDGATDVGDEGTTGPESVVPGTYTVGETAGTGTNLSKYTTSVECLNHAGEGDPTPVTETEVQGGWDVDVDSNDEIVCTITNSRNTGSLEVVKNLEPASDTGLFNLFINDDQGGAVGDGATDVGDEGTTGPESVVPGTYTVGDRRHRHEPVRTTTSVECLNHAGEGGPTPVTETEVQGGWDVDVDSNDEIVCTITNSRTPAHSRS